jgi:hypothetical protein
MLRAVSRACHRAASSTSRALVSSARLAHSSAGKELVERDAREPETTSSPWRPVVDDETRRVYYWNIRTGETTAVGAPRPRTEYLADDVAPPRAVEGVGVQMGTAFVMGAGVSTGFAFVGVVARLFG